jgi:hypothetical protein
VLLVRPKSVLTLSLSDDYRIKISKDCYYFIYRWMNFTLPVRLLLKILELIDDAPLTTIQ